MKLRVINGPNLNFLGIREKNIYGTMQYEDLCRYITEEAQKRGHTVSVLQSNSEGTLIDFLQQAYQEHVEGIIINPGPRRITAMPCMTPSRATRSRRWRCTCPTCTKGRRSAMCR